MEKFIIILFISVVIITIATYVIYNFIYNKKLNEILETKKRYNLPRPIILVNNILVVLLLLSIASIYVAEKKGLFLQDIHPKIIFGSDYYDLNNTSKKSAINVYKPFLLSKENIDEFKKEVFVDDENFTLIIYFEEKYENSREFLVYFNYKGNENFDTVKSNLFLNIGDFNESVTLNSYDFSNNIAYKGYFTEGFNVILIVEYINDNNNITLNFRKEIKFKFSK